MNCPACGGHNSRVLESRIAEAGDAMRRRRECLDCANRFTTYERIERATLWVTKRDGRQQPFDRAKLLRGLAIACSKRDVPRARLEQLVEQVEEQLRECCGSPKEVHSRQVGELALAGLVRIDEAAAIRFASVIQRAGSLGGFRQVLDRMTIAAAELDEAVAGLGEGAAGTDEVTPELHPARTREALAAV